jgi:hypothetical protein
MDDLVAFISRCVDEDERVALACRDEEFWGPGEDVPVPARRHIARHDPARVLAEVAAKREILRDYEEMFGFDLPPGVAEGRDYGERVCDEMVRAALRRCVRALAQPLAGRRGWRSEWATELTT